MTATKERPILFSGPMVRAIMEGRKTQTRRIVKPQPPEGWSPLAVEYYHPAIDDGDMMRDGPEIFGAYGDDWGVKCPYGGPGDRLWVRETWAPRADVDPVVEPDKAFHYCMYKAEGGDPADPMNWHDYGGRWRPSIHMPRWASRITLEITEVRVQRVQDISAKDIIADGAVNRPHHDDAFGKCPVSQFDGCVYVDLRRLWASAWDQVNGKGAWQRNDWVWAIGFRKIVQGD